MFHIKFLNNSLKTLYTNIKPFKETFRKIYIVQRTNEAEIRLGEQSENTESCRDNLWNETQVKGP